MEGVREEGGEGEGEEDKGENGAVKEKGENGAAKSDENNEKVTEADSKCCPKLAKAGEA